MPAEGGQRHPSYRRRPLAEPLSPQLIRDSTDALLTATGRGDLGAFAEFYDQTTPTVFGLLRIGTNESAGTTHATEQAY